MKSSEELKVLRGYGEERLAEELRAEKEALLKLRFQRESHQLSSPALLGRTRRKIARILTEMKSRSMNSEGITTNG